MNLGKLSEEMGDIELSEPLKPEIVRLMQMALYYDFVLYNMQQKPFYVLLSVHGGAMKNMDRSTLTELYRIDPNTIHAALVKCLKSKSQCDTADLGMQVKAIKEMYNEGKIEQFKAVTKTTPAKLYDLLNPGDGDINVAIQKAAREIMAYSPSQNVLYLGDDDEVFQLIFKDAAVGFLDHETVEAIRSIMEPKIALPRRMGGRRTRQRGTRRHGPKRHNRRSYKTKKRTRRH